MGNLFYTEKYSYPACSICLEKYNKLPNLYSLTCGHIFCDKCLLILTTNGICRCAKCRLLELINWWIPRNFKCIGCKKNIFYLYNLKPIYLLSCDHYICTSCIHIIPHFGLAHCNNCKKPKEFIKLFF